MRATAPLVGALARLRARRGRTLLAAAGIAASGTMIGTATALSFGLATGFDRAVERSDLPDVVARFEARTREDVEDRVGALANVEARSLRLEIEGIGLAAPGGSSREGVVQLVPAGRRGYAVVEGTDLRGEPGEVLIERGVAREWDLSVGDSLAVGQLGRVRVAGIAVSPDDVAFPLAASPRVYLPEQLLPSGFRDRGRSVNLVMLWARDPGRLDELLVQARSQSFGLENLRFTTREGVRALVDQAAGIVIALLIAFSLVALATAGVMLGASARADVQRRLETIGVMRAVGFTRAGLAARYAGDAALVAVPAAVAGLGAGALLASGPSARLLEILNELPPGAAVIAPLAGCLVAIVLLVVIATTWPAWRAASQPPAQILRGAELRHTARRSRTPAGPFGLGLRLALARRGRTLATAGVVAAATAVVLLMLAVASYLGRLQDDPGVIGKRYEVTAALPASSAAAVAALPGVAAAAPRYVADGIDSFALGQPVRLIAFPGDHVPFEDPPLAEGRRVANDREAEVGQGLAEALGVRPGGTLAVQLSSGAEARFRVVGIVRTVDREGRVAYVRSARVVAGDSGVEPEIAIRLEEGVGAADVRPALAELGAEPRPVGAATPRNQAFLGVLAGVLRLVALVNGLICLYVLTQALVVMAAERRSTIALLRATGARRGTIALVLAGIAGVVVALAAPLGVLGERLLLGPTTARLAAGYADLPLGAGVPEIVAVVAGLALLAGGATAWVARRVESEPVAAGLRER
ncbi:MAG: FtsX-like permease family protein [Thermoleophilaceae bacterium]